MDVNGIVGKVNLKLNDQKFEEFISQYRPKIESGEITFEELCSLAADRFFEFHEAEFVNYEN